MLEYASNQNTARPGVRPYVNLKPSGDGRMLARALARVIVRQELIFATLIEDQARCRGERAAG